MRPLGSLSGRDGVVLEVEGVMTKRQDILSSDPETLSGTTVFVGTRVPVQNLLDYLAAGDTLDTFLEDFPSVSREQAQAALELAGEALTAGASSS